MNKVIVTLLGIITAVLLLVGGFYIGQQMSQKQTPQKKELPSSTPSPTSTPSTGKGVVEGSLSYPSEGIPEDMYVCAETAAGESVDCTQEQITGEEYEYGVGYKLEISPGTYFIYAKLPESEYKAYYTEFVTCGLSVDCESHEKIKVSVKAGEVVQNIDPIDWYNNSPSE